MLINLTKSKLFTTDPSERFSREYGVSPTLWKEIWKRYKLMDYRVPELCEFYYIKVGGIIKPRIMYRWIFRAEVYSKALPVMNKGVRVVNSEFFGEYESKVTEEIVKHLKSGVAKNSRIMA